MQRLGVGAFPIVVRNDDAYGTIVCPRAKLLRRHRRRKGGGAIWGEEHGSSFHTTTGTGVWLRVSRGFPIGDAQVDIGLSPSRSGRVLQFRRKLRRVEGRLVWIPNWIFLG